MKTGLIVHQPSTAAMQPTSNATKKDSGCRKTGVVVLALVALGGIATAWQANTQNKPLVKPNVVRQPSEAPHHYYDFSSLRSQECWEVFTSNTKAYSGVYHRGATWDHPGESIKKHVWGMDSHFERYSGSTGRVVCFPEMDAEGLAILSAAVPQPLNPGLCYNGGKTYIKGREFYFGFGHNFNRNVNTTKRLWDWQLGHKKFAQELIDKGDFPLGSKRLFLTTDRTTCTDADKPPAREYWEEV